jgi:ubiquinone/menaquinone biosynthesis C-methylase UbiE
MAQLEFDEKTARELEVLYATRDVLRRRRLVREAIAAQPGERILDVGCGPGFYVAELLEEVGPEGSIVAVDGSDAMLAVAAHRVAGHDNVAFHTADATSLPVGDGEFDRVFSVQVLEYVADVPAALAEMYRVLKPGGRVVIWDVDWGTMSMRTADETRMQRVSDAWDEHLAHPALPRTLSAQLRGAGFVDVEMEGHTFATNDLDPETYGGFFIDFIPKFVRGRESVEAAEVDAWVAEQRELGQRGEFYFAVVQFCFSATK